jgi:hypothetical protein
MAVMAAVASVIALAAGAGEAPAAEKANPSRETLIQRIDVQHAAGKTTIRAIAGRPILYSAIPQANPPALILNVTGARLGKGVGTIPVKDALVQDVLATQAPSGAPAARIAITGRAGARFDVHPDKDGLVVEVTSAAAAPVARKDATGKLLARLGGAEKVLPRQVAEPAALRARAIVTSRRTKARTVQTFGWGSTVGSRSTT